MRFHFHFHGNGNGNGNGSKLLTKSISQCKMKMLQGIFGDRCGRTADICCRCLDARKIACGKAAQTLRTRIASGKTTTTVFPKGAALLCCKLYQHLSAY